MKMLPYALAGCSEERNHVVDRGIYEVNCTQEADKANT